jgi:SagB-type dehydrogenase family enzyme
MPEREHSRGLAEASLNEQIALPDPHLKSSVSVEEAILRRRSVRDFLPEPLALAEISQLLWSAQGQTSPEALRAAPSAGARYPLEVYLACAEGLFLYQPRGHALIRLGTADPRLALTEAAYGQAFIAQAPVSLAFAAVYLRTTSRYGERGRRYVHIDVGHAAQNVHLQAEAMGLSSVPVGAFDDAAVAAALQLPSDQKPLYIIPVGRAARG